MKSKIIVGMKKVLLCYFAASGVNMILMLIKSGGLQGHASVGLVVGTIFLTGPLLALYAAWMELTTVPTPEMLALCQSEPERCAWTGYAIDLAMFFVPFAIFLWMAFRSGRQRKS